LYTAAIIDILVYINFNSNWYIIKIKGCICYY